MWIFKIGGSWIKNPKLDELATLFNKFKDEKIVIVTGGGCFADSVRCAYKNSNMNEKTGNFLALKATEIFAHYLKIKNPNFFLSDKEDEFYENKIKIWLPSKVLSKERTFEKNWNSTSDSVAVWLGNKIVSKGIIFLKSLSFSKTNTYSLNTLQNQDILDQNVKKYLSKGTILKIVGPEIMGYLKKNNDWGKLVSNLCDVNY